MKKILCLSVILALSIVFFTGCSERIHFPTPTEPEEPIATDTLFFAKAWVNPDSGQAPLNCSFFAYGAYMVVPKDPSVHQDTVILLTGQFAYLWKFYSGGKFLSDSSDFLYTFENKGSYVITCKVTNLSTNESITQFLKVKVTGSCTEPTDTLVIIDTVVVIVDSSSTSHFCGQIKGPAKQILWLLQNDAGNYRLEFEANTNSGKTADLTVDISGVTYSWNTGQSETFTASVFLKQDSTIKITKGKNQGDATSVCVKIVRV